MPVAGDYPENQNHISHHHNPHHPRHAAAPVPPPPQQQAHRGEKMTIALYIRYYWMDWLGLALMGALGLAIYLLRPVPNRQFPIYFRDGEVIYPEFAYPLNKNIVPIWLAAFLAFTIPAVTFVLLQIRIRNFNDLNTAVMGVIMSLITAAVFQVFLKWLIGGLRPHFYSVCKPSIDPSLANAGAGFSGIMVDRSVCTGDEKEINDALESFPSGHSTAAFAGFLFLSWYLNGKLKIFANYRPHYWKLVLFFAPILGATLIAGSLTIDKFHHWYDVVGGGIIGSVIATATYRFQYAALFDYRFNHVPLPRRSHHSFRYSTAQPSDSMIVKPATRKAGWDTPYGGAFGAPGDAVTSESAAFKGMGADTMVAPHSEMHL
ncbi:phosphatidic acid phosphatase type 2/haloperoxidase [Phlyctochytrium arcticum]|nr:phosphatidic acid phosphatase type 2/haloperoxidase [Phlyctochytrium arcticum]